MTIGTHNSGTGEPSRTWWHTLLLPFACTQFAGLKAQFEAGARVFDLRARWCGGRLVLAHGLWESSTTLTKAFQILSNAAEEAKDKVYVMVTYEGDEKASYGFQYAVWSLMQDVSPWFVLTYINVKLPDWKCLDAVHPIETEQGFVSLEWPSWKCLLPVPFIWWLFRSKDVSDAKVVLVDFIKKILCL